MKYLITVASILLLIGGSTQCSNNHKTDHEEINRAVDSGAIQFREHPASCAHVQTDGILASRMAFNLGKLISSRQLHTKYAGWGADQIGRWIGAAILEATLLRNKASLPILSNDNF